MVYVVTVVAEYARTLKLDIPDGMPEWQAEMHVAQSASRALEELPDEMMDGKWKFDWDNVQSGGIYSDYYKEESNE